MIRGYICLLGLLFLVVGIILSYIVPQYVLLFVTIGVFNVAVFLAEYDTLHRSKRLWPFIDKIKGIYNERPSLYIVLSSVILLAIYIFLDFILADDFFNIKVLLTTRQHFTIDLSFKLSSIVILALASVILSRTESNALSKIIIQLICILILFLLISITVLLFNKTLNIIWPLRILAYTALPTWVISVAISIFIEFSKKVLSI